jgi:hypothetical protein
MKVMEAIGKSFGIAAKSFNLLVLLFVFNLIWGLAPLPLYGNVQNPANVNINPPLIVLSALFIFINIFVQGGIFGALKDAIISGHKTVLSNFVEYGRRFYLRFLCLGLFVLLAILLSTAIIGVIFSISLVAKNVVLNIIAVSAATILAAIGLYYLFLLFFSPYALVMDDTGVFKAMGNSMRFVKSNLLKITGLSTLLILIAFGIAFIVGIATGMASFAIKGRAFQIATNIATSAVIAYITVIISACLMVYYHGLSGSGKDKGTERISA